MEDVPQELSKTGMSQPQPGGMGRSGGPGVLFTNVCRTYDTTSVVRPMSYIATIRPIHESGRKNKRIVRTIRAARPSKRNSIFTQI